MRQTEQIMKNSTSSCQVLVSIIMPCYNTARYVKEAIKSVQDQTYQNFEIITIDDGSTDNTVAVLKELQAKDDRITVLEQEHSNATKARINAEKHAKGKYLLFLDSDDKIHPEFLEKCLAVAETDENIAFVYTGVTNFDKIDKTLPSHKVNLKILLLAGCVFVTSLIRRTAYQAVGGFDTDFNFYEDRELYISLVSYGYKYKLIEDPLLYYRKRISKDSICDQATFESEEEAFLKIYFKHKKLFYENNIYLYQLAFNETLFIVDLIHKEHPIYKKAKFFLKKIHYSKPWVQLYYRIFKPKKYKRILKEYNLE